MAPRTYDEISHYRAPYKNSVLSGLGAAPAQGAALVSPAVNEFFRAPYEMFLNSLQALGQGRSSDARAHAAWAARYVETAAAMAPAASAGDAALKRFLSDVAQLFGAGSAASLTAARGASGFGALPTRLADVSPVSEKFLDLPYATALDLAEDIGKVLPHQLVVRAHEAFTYLDNAIRRVDRTFDFGSAQEMGITSKAAFQSVKARWLSFLRGFRNALVKMATTPNYGAVAQFRAPWSNRVMSGLGATDTSQVLPYGPATDAGKAVRTAAIATFSTDAEASVNGTKRLSGKGREAALLSIANYFANLAALPSADPKTGGPSMAFIYAAPNPKLGGGIGLTDGDASMLALLGYWLDQTGAPANLPAATSAVEKVVPRGKNWVYFTQIASGDTAVPLIVVRNAPLDGARCAEEAQKAGLPDCDLLELFKPGEALPGSLASTLPKPQPKTASMLTYGLVGVGVVAAALVFFSKKRKATPNRRRRSRR